MAADCMTAVVAHGVMAAPTVSASLVVASPQGDMVEAPVVPAVVSTSTSRATSVDPAVVSELMLPSAVVMLSSVVPVADVHVVAGLMLEPLAELVVLALVAVVEFVAAAVVELLVKLVAQVLAMLLLISVLVRVTVVPMILTVVITAATILISGFSMAAKSQSRSRP